MVPLYLMSKDGSIYVSIMNETIKNLDQFLIQDDLPPYDSYDKNGVIPPDDVEVEHD
ncbi:hypothetical protein Pmar_PMAR002443, partial [Perkinsus marinus ATCC 50983]